WIKDDYTYLVQACTGEAWVAAVSLWLKLEKLLDVPVDGRGRKFQLATKNRPSQIPHWVSRGRRFEKPPEVGKPAEFMVVWRKWWIALQPEWRGDDWPLSRTGATGEETWEETLKGGRNGFEMILVSLSWWGAVAKTEKQKREWELAVEDVQWVAEQMLTHLGNEASISHKRDGEALPEGAPAKKK
ncbi:hypothetical protein BV25DRAFT_1816697, partial [Artomyces pyxidatus]